VVSVGPGLVAVVSVESAGAADAVDDVVVLIDGAGLLEVLAVLTAGRRLPLEAATFLWESPPQAPSPKTATTANAVT
jgi:hypothetical protein